MSSIGAVCNSLGKTFLSLLVDNLGATAILRLNSSAVKVKLIIFPLFLPEGNPILPITPKAVCGSFIGGGFAINGATTSSFQDKTKNLVYELVKASISFTIIGSFKVPFFLIT